ncbi:efflux RND transporter periplasmic adaptor subunit [Ornithinibacillus sp. L9]|uniref:Efflux RND transporter periplasmic adaptor subunit n=1 Tax=Ornithinibacillus caprae TaxID=2678566 RepID=A0A6N8FJA3_9BACI|nr:efflux RND transporter periplasmic adaptor subunit [Ornithinibacillus caprae]MUK89690.1 efflux RND transporter periplasmic adaptor subunit [Ornithinibacillus caprae]
MKKLMIIAGILLIGLLTACTEEDQSNEEEQERVAPVEIAEATEGDLVVESSLFGRTAPNSMTPIMLQNPGEIDVLEVEDGDMVEEDDLIATILTPAGKQNVYAAKDGKIVNLEAEEGAMVSNSDPLAMIADMDTMKLQFNVTADMLSHIEKGDTFTAIINGTEYEAEVSKVGQMPNDTGLYAVEASVDNEEGDIVTGVVAQMNVPVSRVENTILVPTAAIVDESDETFVYIVTDDQAVKTTVTIKETQSEQTAIEGDIAEGDQIVVNGQLLLSDGTKVDIIEESGE